MESRKSYLTTQLNKCDYRSGSRCRYYQGRDDGRSLQEAVDAFQGSFVEEHIGTVSIVMHFRVWGAERRRETRFLFFCALEVFRRSQVPLLSFKYCLSSLGTIYIFTAFPFESSPLVRRFMLLACPKTAFASVLEGVEWVDMRWRCHFTHLSQQKPKEM